MVFRVKSAKATTTFTSPSRKRSARLSRQSRGCQNANSCKLKEVTVPGCGWKTNQKEKSAVADAKKVYFSLNIKGVDPPSLADNIEEKSEAVLFQMQYAVSTGQFRISLYGVNSTADRSSFEHVSSDIECYPGFVRSTDRKECGKWRLFQNLSLMNLFERLM